MLSSNQKQHIVKEQIKLLFDTMKSYAEKFEMNCGSAQELLVIALEIVEFHSDLDSLMEQLPLITNALAYVVENDDNIGDPALLFSTIFSSKQDLVASFVGELPQEYQKAVNE